MGLARPQPRGRRTDTLSLRTDVVMRTLTLLLTFKSGGEGHRYY